MLKGCVPWPPEFARRYIKAGIWEGITVAEMVERAAADATVEDFEYPVIRSAIESKTP